jgi:predicted metal-dependent peptidase
MQTQEYAPDQAACETHLAAATLRLCCDRPYLAAALWAMERVARPGLGTMAVDRRWRLYYDPATVLGWSVEALAGVLYHEVCHLLRDHAGRAGMAEDPYLWNLAADAEINDDLQEEQVLLPGSPVYPSTLRQPDGLLAEEYYARLPRTDAALNPAHTAGRGESRDTPPLPGGLNNGEQGAGPAGGCCGSCATGVPYSWELSEPTVVGLTEADAELVRHQVALAVRTHTTAAGSLPGHWSRWAEERLEPQVDWRSELAAIVRGALHAVAGACDYTYARPSRRQGCAGPVVLPALRQPVPNVAVIVDTSGSMTDGMLSSALAEIAGILLAAGQREGVTVLSVDAAVHACRRVFAPEQVAFLGGGGTDMGAGLAAVERLVPRPDVAIVLTDGYTPWPERSPHRLRTVVALTDPGGSAPAWAKTVLLKERSSS